MKKVEILKNVGLILSIIIIIFLMVYIVIVKISCKVDKDYQKLGLNIEYYEIEYYIVYEEDFFSEYKVYKIKSGSEFIENLKNQLENSDLWSKEKFDEYIMQDFYERNNEEKIKIGKEDLYYYHHKGIYAIFDIQNAKLYYYDRDIILGEAHDSSSILGIRINNYINRKVYDVRGGPQNDGTDYYIYEFTEEKGKEIEVNLEKYVKWSKNKLEDDILDNFKYNEEVLSIKNGYYYYALVCRTSDEYKKAHFTKEEATGYEVGVYDIDNNKLYYYWTSY